MYVCICIYLATFIYMHTHLSIYMSIALSIKLSIYIKDPGFPFRIAWPGSRPSPTQSHARPLSSFLADDACLSHLVNLAAGT